MRQATASGSLIEAVSHLPFELGETPPGLRDRRAICRMELLTPAGALRLARPGLRYYPRVGVWLGLFRSDQRTVGADGPVDGFEGGLVGHPVLSGPGKWLKLAQNWRLAARIGHGLRFPTIGCPRNPSSASG